jgi:hypothetical protein
VHRFAVVRVGVKRKIVNALDLIVRRGVLPSSEGKPKQPSRPGKPKVRDRKLDPEEPRILLHDPTLAGPQAWILPGMHPQIKVLGIEFLTLI